MNDPRRVPIGRYAGRGFTADHQRALMSRFPAGVVVVTAVADDGVPHGMTCTSLASVSLSPPTLLVCLAGGSGTLAAVRSTGVFAVNLLAADGRATAELFASSAHDRFARVRWRPGDDAGTPWLVEGVLGTASCRVSSIVPAGDHDVVLGEIVAVGLQAGVPLLYGLRRYAGWPCCEPVEVQFPAAGVV